MQTSHFARILTSRSDRWNTPPDLLREIEAFMPGYSDPCPAGAVLADGLALRWAGRVYLNPPYGRTIGLWIQKALSEPVQEIVMLLPARTETRWFQPLWGLPMCFVRGRLCFSGQKANAPFPSVLVYRGPRSKQFARAFQHRGPIVRAK